MSTRNTVTIVAVVVLVIIGGYFLFFYKGTSPYPAATVPGSNGSSTTYPNGSPSATGAQLGQNGNPPIPAGYQSLYTTLENDLTSDTSAINTAWNGAKYPVNYSTVVISADGNTDSMDMNAVNQELDGDQLMGMNAVEVDVGFPTFDPNYYTFSGQSSGLAQQKEDFYASVAAAVHSRGMKLIVEANPLLTSAAVSTSNGAGPVPYYQSLTYAQYLSRRSAGNVIIAQQMKPDYLLLQSEPSTDSSQVQNSAIATQIINPATDAQMISQFVTDLTNANIPGLHSTIKLGAGMGTWQKNWQEYLADFDAIPGLDSIDCHVYSIVPSQNEIGIAMQIADAAHAAGKGASIAEFWDHKSLDGSEGNNTRAVDTFSFWAPLDEQFLLAMMKLANEKHLDYLSSFAGLGNLSWSYLDYTAAPCNPSSGTTACYNQILGAEKRVADQALANHTLSPYGTAYKDYIANLPM